MAAQIRLKDDGWLPKAMALKGFKNQTALADAMGVNRSTVSRALSDKQDIGKVFLVGLLSAFPELGFEDLFDVVHNDAPFDAGSVAQDTDDLLDEVSA